MTPAQPEIQSMQDKRSARATIAARCVLPGAQRLAGSRQLCRFQLSAVSIATNLGLSRELETTGPKGSHRTVIHTCPYGAPATAASADRDSAYAEHQPHSCGRTHHPPYQGVGIVAETWVENALSTPAESTEVTT